MVISWQASSTQREGFDSPSGINENADQLNRTRRASAKMDSEPISYSHDEDDE